MNVKLTRKLKLIYQKEKISAFIFTFGAMDAILGGFSERWTLLSLGILLVIIGGWMRWLQIQKNQKIISVTTSRRYLNPARSDLTPLPPLKRKRD
ncbi:hypothetical protein [Geminocystis sp. GBBB08]|uniref:hypothetical protein n=1 Tax=Geminocystis sp. GBBB08 TaxID=2604140 RepID=UPI0027E2F8AF|nr:hypothetical protein [Geminocystis sp. GBBB08]MBL1209636.1 hypothetical protein [Geminocystis sp. GBBB08]